MYVFQTPLLVRVFSLKFDSSFHICYTMNVYVYMYHQIDVNNMISLSYCSTHYTFVNCSSRACDNLWIAPGLVPLLQLLLIVAFALWPLKGKSTIPWHMDLAVVQNFGSKSFFISAFSEIWTFLPAILAITRCVNISTPTKESFAAYSIWNKAQYRD